MLVKRAKQAIVEADEHVIRGLRDYWRHVREKDRSLPADSLATANLNNPEPTLVEKRRSRSIRNHLV